MICAHLHVVDAHVTTCQVACPCSPMPVDINLKVLPGDVATSLSTHKVCALGGPAQRLLSLPLCCCGGSLGTPIAHSCSSSVCSFMQCAISSGHWQLPLQPVWHSDARTVHSREPSGSPAESAGHAAGRGEVHRLHRQQNNSSTSPCQGSCMCSLSCSLSATNHATLIGGRQQLSSLAADYTKCQHDQCRALQADERAFVRRATGAT